MRLFLDLTKSGIVAFVLLSGAAGYALSHETFETWDWLHFTCAMSALYFLSSGSFALNQVQEWRIDGKMPRTENRPIPSGRVSVLQASVIGFGFVALGLFFALLVSPLVAGLGFATVAMYNLMYTPIWKRRWAFGAVPGALPGAMPVAIGYAANSGDLLKPELFYAFLIMFLWQMPHFWSLAIRFKDDYEKGGIPVLPLRLGNQATVFHMGLYMFTYVALAVASPWFVSARWAYALLTLPIAFKILWEFLKYHRQYQTGGVASPDALKLAGNTGARWLPFFLWTNLSVLIFLIAPVIDKWQMAFSAP